MSNPSAHLPVVVLFALLAACAAPGPRAGGPSTGRSADHVTAEEIGGSTGGDAYELVRTLRPAWLRTRGATTFQNEGAVAVFIDNVPLGGPDALRQIPAGAVLSMEFVGTSAATQRWGTGYVHGAIVVTTRR